jgi:protein O-mannosyl-transferase
VGGFVKIEASMDGTVTRHQATSCSPKSLFLLAAGLACVTFIAFLPVLSAGYLNYDDGVYVAANPFIQSGFGWSTIQWAFTSDYAANWHPLTWLSHALDRQLFGPGPGGPHLVNLVFHVANSVLLLMVLNQLTGAVWKSFVVAALFALHPLHVESVAWISERKDVLSAFFFLLTLLVYVSYVRSNRSIRWYLLALFCFSAGLMCKPMLVTTPFVLLLLDHWPLDRFKNVGWRKLLVEKVPFIALAAVSGVVTFYAQKRGGAIGLTHFSLVERLENAVVSYGRYAGKTVWPIHLAVFYPHPGGWPLLYVGASAVFLAAATFFAVRHTREKPFLMVGWFWFAGMLTPVIGIIQVGMQSIADRYTYLPLIGLFIAVVWGLTPVLKHHSRISVLLAAVILGGCATLTFAQTRVWHDNETISRHAIAVTGANGQAELDLAVELELEGKLSEAITHYFEVLKINPNDAETYNNLAGCFLRMDDATNAAIFAGRAVALSPRRPQANYNLANAYYLEGKPSEAALYYEKAIQLNPGYAEAHFNLAVLLEEEGDYSRSALEFGNALRLRPNWDEASNNLARVKARSSAR